MPELVKVAKVSDVPEGSSKRVKVFDLDIAVFHVEGRFFAIGDRCTHAGASLADGPLDGLGVLCPWHLARFNLETGAAETPPAYDPVPCFPVSIVGEDIFLETPKTA